MYKIALILILITMVLFPEIPLDGFPDIRVEDLVLFVLLLVAIKNYLFNKFLYNKNKINKYFFLFASSILISILYAVIVKNYYPIARDFFEFIKVFKYFAIFALISSYKFTEKELKHIFYLTLVLFSVNSFVAIFQFFNFFNINSLAHIYTDTQIRNLIVNKRVFGTYGNSNYFGASLMLPLALAFVRFLNIKRKQYIYILLIILYTIAIVMTNSRAALIMYLTVLFFSLIFNYTRELNLRMYIFKSITIMLCALILLIGLISVMPGNSSNRILSLIPIIDHDGDVQNERIEDNDRYGEADGIDVEINDTSLNKRMFLWKDTIDKWKESIIFGWGPGKRSMRRFVDGEWFLLLRRYGLLGITIFLFWMGRIFLDMRRFHGEYSGYSRIFALSVRVLVIAYLMFMIPAQLFHSIRLMSLFMFCTALVYSQNSKRKELKYEGINFISPISK
ncbi:MAG: O-antigen ligase family protein [bacterium]